MIQQGQVFKLKAKGADGQALWAYGYRIEGRASMRPQMSGFTSRADAQKALRKALDRIGPGRGGAITLAELVDEYLELHQARVRGAPGPPGAPPRRGCRAAGRIRAGLRPPRSGSW